MEQIGLKELLIGVIALGQIIGVIVLFRGADALVDIREHLNKLNGRIGTCERLQEAHEQSDRDKHESCEKRIEAMEHLSFGQRNL